MPGYFAVRRVRGPAWDRSRSLREQALWVEHADFMNALAAAGFVVLGGPLGAGEETLLVIDAGSEEEIRARLAGDPWSQARLLSRSSAWSRGPFCWTVGPAPDVEPGAPARHPRPPNAHGSMAAPWERSRHRCAPVHRLESPRPTCGKAVPAVILSRNERSLAPAASWFSTSSGSYEQVAYVQSLWDPISPRVSIRCLSPTGRGNSWKSGWLCIALLLTKLIPGRRFSSVSRGGCGPGRCAGCGFARRRRWTPSVWYERERPGLGLEFLEAIRAAFQRIEEAPRQFRLSPRDSESDPASFSVRGLLHAGRRGPDGGGSHASSPASECLGEASLKDGLTRPRP